MNDLEIIINDYLENHDFKTIDGKRISYGEEYELKDIETSSTFKKFLKMHNRYFPDLEKSMLEVKIELGESRDRKKFYKKLFLKSLPDFEFEIK